MKQQQQLHSVKLLVPTRELGELFSWVTTLSGTTLVSTEQVEPEERPTMKFHKVKTDEEALDPRLVYQLDERGNTRIDVKASLVRLNLTMEDLGKMKTRCGTSEHKVKMATVTNKRTIRNGSTPVGPAEMKSGTLSNRAS
mgnify:CR=1 FL=1|jgi:hypothetical protein